MGPVELRDTQHDRPQATGNINHVQIQISTKVVKYPEKHLLKGHRDLTTRSKSRATRALEKSVTVGKLQLLWDSKPAIPMAHDFSQAEAPPDGSWDEAGSPEPQSGDRPALVWVTVLPCVTSVQTDDEGRS
ncbi:hypothetical protein R3I93_019898 [Phoxinus phoxinus]|uniref:Uncharacterized protein n=1 Tax=Phoxinus phoxinus TaxID=58324 RepID=A0AAN9GWW2_9TELE